MNFKTILKVISAIVAIAGVAVAVYLAIQKLTAPKEAEYFDDSDFFECDKSRLRKRRPPKRAHLRKRHLLKRLPNKQNTMQ